MCVAFAAASSCLSSLSVTSAASSDRYRALYAIYREFKLHTYVRLMLTFHGDQDLPKCAPIEHGLRWNGFETSNPVSSRPYRAKYGS